MRPTYLLGIDIGTQGSKGVIVSREGAIVAREFIEHGLSTPRPGWAEHDADAIWWADFLNLTRRLLREGHVEAREIAAVGVCALSPDMLPVDEEGRPLRPGILYGIDTRASAEIVRMNHDLGCAGPTRLTSSDVGPKIVWFQTHEPERWRRTSKVVSAHGYVVARLTDRYTIDRTTAGGFRPFFDAAQTGWDARACARYDVPTACLPEVVEPTEVVGGVTAAAAADTGLAEGTPVIAGATDLPAEAVSTGACDAGDLVVGYGTTMTVLAFTEGLCVAPGLWSGPNLLGGLGQLYAGRHVMVGGMATAAALTRWFRDNFGQTERRAEPDLGIDAYRLLELQAEAVPPGSDGLIVLPYFSGERTPIHDEQAQGVLFGLTLAHTRGHVYRALLEGISYGLAHHVDLMQQAGAGLRRIVGTGGGSRSPLWAQIVSDVTGLPQVILSRSSAALGVAFLAGVGVGLLHSLEEMRAWLPRGAEIAPREDLHARYREYYCIYRQLYEHTKEDMHALTRLRAGPTASPVADPRDGLAARAV